MKKKLIKLFALLAACVSACVLCAVCVFAAAPNVSVEFGDVFPNEDFRVRLSVEGGGIYGISGTFTYDESKMTFVGIRLLAQKPYELDTHGNTFLVYDTKMSSPINIKTDVLEFEFSPKSGVKEGDVMTFGFSELVLSDGVSDYTPGKHDFTSAVKATPEDNVYLKELKIGEGDLIPVFSKETFTYTVSVDRKTSKVTVTASPEDPESKVEIGDTTLNEKGATTFEISVTGKRGGKRTYLLTVYKEEPVSGVPGQLGGLEAEGFILSPPFKPEVREYAVYIPYEVSSLKVGAVTSGDGDTVSIVGADGLKVGDNSIRIVITSPDGTKSEYRIKAVKADKYQGEKESEPKTADPGSEKEEPVKNGGSEGGGFPAWLAVFLVITALIGGVLGGYYLRKRFPDGIVVAFRKRFGKTKLYK